MKEVERRLNTELPTFSSLPIKTLKQMLSSPEFNKKKKVQRNKNGHPLRIKGKLCI